jgi:hypothetical protein
VVGRAHSPTLGLRLSAVFQGPMRPVVPCDEASGPSPKCRCYLWDVSSGFRIKICKKAERVRASGTPDRATASNCPPRRGDTASASRHRLGEVWARGGDAKQKLIGVKEGKQQKSHGHGHPSTRQVARSTCPAPEGSDAAAAARRLPLGEYGLQRGEEEKRRKAGRAGRLAGRARGPRPPPHMPVGMRGGGRRAPACLLVVRACVKSSGGRR